MEKTEIIAQAFKEDPDAKLLYLSKNNTVLTEAQYQATENKDGIKKYGNPAFEDNDEDGEGEQAPAPKKAASKKRKN